MKLRTRLTTAVVVVSSAGTLLLGGLGISEVRDSKFDAIDRTLLAVTAQTAADATDQVSAALFAADRSRTAVALGFSSPGGGFTWLRELPDAEVPTPDARTRRAALAAPFTTAQGFRMAAVALADGETVYVAASTDDIDHQTRTDVLTLLAFWVLLSAVTGLLIRIIVRRDVAELERLVVAAREIAEGARDVEVPAGGSSSEVETLSAALRRMIASLRAAVTAEQATNQRMQVFLGDASHELRTPLTVIRGYLELLEQDVEPQQRDRALFRMRAEAQRMEMLVNDLLLLAEIGTTVPEQPETIDLTALVRVLVDDLSELQPQREVTSSIETGMQVHAVPSHLHRAIGNAFANIRRHTAASDAVRVNLHRDGGAAVLVVEDAGPGLSESMYAQGMGHFQRFDKSRARSSGGSGLGMSIIAAVMAELGGHVTATRSELGGLQLRYVFPLQA